MDLKSLEIFVYAAEQNSFTKAAQRLGYTQAAVSLQIKQLEQTLGVMLFERINHSIKLTPKGKELLSLAHQVLDLTEEIKKSASNVDNEIKGNVKIAMSDSLCHWMLWNNYEKFHNEFPGIRLKIVSGSTQDLFRLAKQNDVDFIFTLDKHIYDNNYIIVKEHPVAVHFVAHRDNELCKKFNLSFSDILNEQFILTEKGMSYRRPLDEKLARESIDLKPILELGDTDLICRLVSQNMGISFLPDFVTKEMVSNGEIRHIDVSDVNSDIWIQMLYHRNKVINPAIQSVMDFLCRCL